MQQDAAGEAVLKKDAGIIVHNQRAARQRTGGETTAHGQRQKADVRKETAGTIHYIQTKQHAMQLQV